jgi:hypothetical protein
MVSHRGSNSCPIRPGPSARSATCLRTRPKRPTSSRGSSLRLWDPTPLRPPDRALNGQDARGKRVLSTEPTATRALSSSTSPLPIREIFSLCVYLREGTAMEHRKKLFWVIDPSDPSAEAEESDNKGSKPERESQVFAKLGRGALLTTDRRSHSLQDKGNHLLMTAFHPVRREHCQTAKALTGERVIPKQPITLLPHL